MSDATNINIKSFVSHRYLFMLRGLFLAVIGAVLCVLCLVNQEPRMMTQSSWLPVIAFLLLLTGGLEIVDALVDRKNPISLIYLSLAIVDLVIGCILLFETNDSIEHIVLLGVAYLLMRGAFRIMAALQVMIFKAGRIVVTGMISIALGIVLWFFIPEQYLVVSMSLFISIDIMIRGLSLMALSYWLFGLYKQQAIEDPGG